MLDSGAFSAWKRGVVIELPEYIAFIRAHLPQFDQYINLDCIPGRPGKPPSAEEVESAAAQSFKNYEVMRRANLEPMPVYHCGESISWLLRMLDSGADYVGLGGTVGKPAKTKREFFKRCFAEIARRPRPAKTHGFGCTSATLVAQFPFTTVDSTSWVMGGANGHIMVPRMAIAGRDYRNLHQVRVTGQGNQNWQIAGMGPVYRDFILKFLREIGTSLEEVRIDQPSRNFVNVHCMDRMGAALGTRMIFSTWMNEPTQGVTLSRAAIRHRLVSYWEIKDCDPAELALYVGKGALAAKTAGRVDFRSAQYVRRRTLGLVARFADGEN